MTAGKILIKLKHLSKLSRLNGKKCLVAGNHDIFGIEEYSKYFYDVRSCKTLNSPCRAIMTHIPVHPDQIFPNGRWKFNIHGHLQHYP